MNKCIILSVIIFININICNANYTNTDTNTTIITDLNVSAYLHNLFSEPIYFKECTGYGKQIENISWVLPTQNIQKLLFTNYNFGEQLISMKCYYYVPIVLPFHNDLQILYDLEILELIIYFNADSGHEYYGMSVSEFYNVFIRIAQSSFVDFYIM